MALLAGSVSVSLGGVVTKNGAAGRLYDILAATAAASIPGGLPSGNAGYKIKKGLADQANDFAEWFVTEMTVHAAVIIPINSIASAVVAAVGTGPTPAPVALMVT